MKEKLDVGPLQSWALGPGGSTGHPLLVLLHGRGSDGADLAGLYPYLQFPGRLLCPDGALPWIEGGVGRCWYEDAGRRRDMENSLSAVLSFLEAAQQRFPTTGRPVLGGFSQGGVLTYELGLRRPELFSGLIVMSAFIAQDNPAKRSPPDPASVPPIMITHGSYDPMITIDRAQEASAWLGAAGIAHEYLEDDVAHSISPKHLEAINAFLATITK